MKSLTGKHIHVKCQGTSGTHQVLRYLCNCTCCINQGCCFADHTSDGKDHTFPATGIEGGVTISQEGYGWKVDQEQEIAKIAEEVDAHAADTREPQYAQREFAASTENNGFGKTYVEVDASRQHIWLYKDGNLVVDGDCVTGLMEQSSYTKPGIYTTAAKESQKKIWTRFYKTDDSRGKDKTGTGLGLSITKEIIEAHNENINVISTEGVGTEFIFTLPKATAL